MIISQYQQIKNIPTVSFLEAIKDKSGKMTYIYILQHAQKLNPKKIHSILFYEQERIKEEQEIFDAQKAHYLATGELPPGEDNNIFRRIYNFFYFLIKKP